VKWFNSNNFFFHVSVCYNYCFNNGLWKITGTTPGEAAECDCTDKYQGKWCQSVKTTTTINSPTTTTDILCTYFSDGFCNIGSCVVNNGKEMCQCPPSHTGYQCETQIGAPSMFYLFILTKILN